MRIQKLLRPGVTTVLVLLFGVGFQTSAWADETIPSYYSNLEFNLASPGALETSVGATANPAVLRMLPGSELQYFWSDDGASLRSIPKWGLFTGGPGLGFSVIHTRFSPGSGLRTAGVTDYRLSLAMGNKNLAVGLGYGWAGGDETLAGRTRVLQLGALQRFGRYVSLGAVGTFSTQSDATSGLYDLAVRPFGDRRLTLFGDAEMQRQTRLKDALWSVGAVIEPAPGFQLTGRYLEDESVVLSVGLSFGAFGAFTGPRFDRNRDYRYTLYGVRLGYEQANIGDRYLRNNQAYLNLPLTGNVRYRKYRLFDDETTTLASVLQTLEDARRDPRIAGVALNLSGANLSRGKAWEINQKLTQLREENKKVVVFIDYADMSLYHVAAAADRIVMDPTGLIMLPGYIMGRTYLVNALKKLGLGVDEWRFFKYKSAFESISRDSMSEADREQRLALIQGYYDEVRADLQASRQVAPDRFDDWVNEKYAFLPDEALSLGLVDKVGRWDEVKEVIEELSGSKKQFLAPSELAGRKFPSVLWGENPRIALVYGLGECDMDKGIRARQLEKIFERLATDRTIKAVVFRVDSPGGDALASDLVAGALKKCAEKKPVIVSQGDVAGSGGYWISMYGTEILALPTTITGSIGVIGGWIWNNGIGDKLGLTSDFVKVGEHADLGFGIRLPFLGIGIPDRNLNQEERKRVEDLFQTMYTGFVNRVAAGRKLEPGKVREIAEGRVWTGRAGLANGLIDRIGGLELALRIAAERAGLGPEEKVDVIEYPPAPILDLAVFFGGRGIWPFSSGASARRDNEESTAEETEDFARDYEWVYLKAMSAAPGRPLYMIPPELLPREEERFDR
jgi:protease-4